jgi:hypothetical protein
MARLASHEAKAASCRVLIVVLKKALYKAMVAEEAEGGG